MYKTRKLFILFFFLWTGALLIAAVVPSFSLEKTAHNIFTPLYVDIPGWIFDSMTNYQEQIRTMDTSAYNPFQDFLWLVWWLSMVALSLVIPVFWWVGITFAFWLSIYAISNNAGIFLISGETIPPAGARYRNHSSAEAANWLHLLNGRTTIDKTFDAEVQANAIASALNRKK